MPQMTPIMWLPLFILITLLLLVMKSTIYFIGSKPTTKVVTTKNYLTPNWLW